MGRWDLTGLEGHDDTFLTWQMSSDGWYFTKKREEIFGKQQEESRVTQGASFGLIFYQEQQFCTLIDLDQ